MIPSLTIHGFDISADTDGWVITLPNAGLNEILSPAPQILAGHTHPFIITENERIISFDRIDDLFRHIAEEFASVQAGRQFVLRSAIGHLLALIFRTHHEPGNAQLRTSSKGAGKLAAFRDRVENHFRLHENIPVYALALGMTPAHLNRICRHITGKTALQIVHERIMIEAKRDLVYSTMTISEVAAVLGFDDPAYFTRFFTRNAGSSPAKYRLTAISELSRNIENS